MPTKSRDQERVLPIAWWLVAAGVFGLVVAIRIRLLGVPLERDEGEYAYAGQLILQGVPPYTLAYNMKFPGTYATYAAIMSIFGQTITGIHLGLLLVNAATIILIFLLGRQLVNSVVGLAAGMSYAVLSVSPSVLGFAGHATHFVLLPALGGTLLLLKATERQPFGLLFASGLLFGLGVLMKQPAVFFALFGAIYLVSNNLHRRFRPEKIFLRTLIFSAGVILPLGITCLLLWRIGVLDRFWFWTIDYARQYGSLVPFSQAPRIFFYSAREVLMASWPICMLAGAGLVAGLWEQRTRSYRSFSAGLPILLCIGTMPGILFSIALISFWCFLLFRCSRALPSADCRTSV
jgi:4-amino-4-deoxy-L-arabinose transferase-like glycosyltransferase